MATVTAGRPLETSVSNSANSVPVEATSPTSTDTLATTSSISTASPVISLPQQEFQCVTRNTFKIGNGSIQRMSDGTVCVDGSIDTIGYAV